MPRLRLAVALCALPQIAAADVSPAELWQEWQSGSIRLSAAEETRRDGALILDGVTAEVPGAGRMLIPRLTLAPEGGAVRVTAGDTARLIADGGAEGALAAPEAALVASGDPGALSYRLDAPRLAVDWADLPSEAGLADLSLGLDAVAATIASSEAGIALRLNAEAAELDTAGPAGPDRLDVAQTWQAPEISYDGAWPVLLGLAPPDPQAATRFRLDATRSELRAGLDGPDGRREIDAETGPVTAEIGVAGGHLDARQTAREVALRLAPAGALPGPLGIRIDNLDLTLDGPAATAASARDMHLDLDLAGITLGDQTWQRLDPAGALPRDPASLDAELVVRLRPDPAGPGGPRPPERLEIRDLRIEALGARAALEGRLDWPDGAPRLAPEGRVGVTLGGAEALIGSLAAAGLLTEGQALFAQLGLTQFTHPAEAGGRAAEIEFGSDGAIAIDGIRLR